MSWEVLFHESVSEALRMLEEKFTDACNTLIKSNNFSADRPDSNTVSQVTRNTHSVLPYSYRSDGYTRISYPN